MAIDKVTNPVKGSALLFCLFCAACSSNQMPAVDETRPSGDERILHASDLMTDGSPIPPHKTSTLNTSMELVSDGLIGGMTVMPDGDLIIADLGSHIWRRSPNGETVLLAEDIEDPSGNLALADGTFLQSEWTKNRILKVAADGSYTVFSDANLNGPVAIVQRPDGDFIVANSRGKFLARVPAAGGAAEVVLRDGRMTQPNGLTIAPDGTIYIADLDTGHVLAWHPDGELSSVVELPGRGNAHNVYVNGVLYVNKIWDHVIYLVDPTNGNYGIVSGTGRPGYSDGVNGRSTIEEPNAITAAPNGHIYFNTHRGAMGRGQPARIVLRTLTPTPK